MYSFKVSTKVEKLVKKKKDKNLSFRPRKFKMLYIFFRFQYSKSSSFMYSLKALISKVK